MNQVQFLTDIAEKLQLSLVPHPEDYPESSFITNFFTLNFFSEEYNEVIIRSNGDVITNSNNIKEHKKLNFHNNYIELAFEVFCLRHNQNWNDANPFVSFGTSSTHKTRYSFIHAKLSSSGLSQVNIRYQAKQLHKISDFVSEKSTYELVKNIIKNKNNLLITGSTGSGKTSFLNSLQEHIGKLEHLIILEDTHELSFEHHHKTHLISSDAAKESLEDFCHYAMRLSPDRLILGEIRSKEVTPLILMMNTGHKGIYSSLHANNAIDGVHRLATLMSYYSKLQTSYESLLKLISKSVEYIIHLDNKKITEIVKINGSDCGQIFFENMIETSTEINLSA